MSETNLRSLQTLVNKSLLRRDNATGRFEIHELLRQFGEEFLQEAGIFENIKAKHAAYYSKFTLSRNADIKSQRQLAALAEIDADFENIKAAWRYACEKADSDTVQQMLETIYWYCNFRHRTLEGFELFELARKVWNDNSLAAGRLLLGFPPRMQDYTEYYERSVAIIQAYDAPLELAFANHRLGHWLSHSLSKHERGVVLMEASAKIYESIAADFYWAVVLDDLGWSYRLQGQTELQLVAITKSVELRRKIGDKVGMADALRNMGGAVGGLGSGNPEPLEKWMEALELSQEIGDKRNIAWNSLMVSVYWQMLGEAEKSLPYRDMAFAVASEIREETVIGTCYIFDAMRQILYTGNYVEARRLLALGYPEGSPYDFRFIMFNITRLLLAASEGDLATMKQSCYPIFEIGRNYTHPIIGIIPFVAFIFHVQRGNYEAAAEAFGFVKASPTGDLLRNWRWFEDYLKNFQAKLDKGVYEAALARGAKRSLREAVEAALALLAATS